MTAEQRCGAKALVLYTRLEEFLAPWQDQKARLGDLISYAVVRTKESKTDVRYPHLDPTGEETSNILDEFKALPTQEKSNAVKSVTIGSTGRAPAIDAPT